MQVHNIVHSAHHIAKRARTLHAEFRDNPLDRPIREKLCFCAADRAFGGESGDTIFAEEYLATLRVHSVVGSVMTDEALKCRRQKIR